MRKLLFMAVLSLPHFALADQAVSQFIYQTDAGKTEVTGALAAEKGEIKFAGDLKMKSTGYQPGVKVEMGLNETLSAGVELNYLFGELKSTGKTRDVVGLTDILLYSRGKIAVGPGLFRFGGHLSLSPEDAKVKQNGDMNAASGGHRLVPFVGYEMAAGPPPSAAEF